MIRQSFEQALQRLQDDILLLGSMTEQAVTRSVEALRARDVVLARQIIADDMRINQKRFAIEDTCVDIIGNGFGFWKTMPTRRRTSTGSTSAA